MKFFKTGKPPVRAEETIEMMAFMEAADESRRQGGGPVKLADVLAKARGKQWRSVSNDVSADRENSRTERFSIRRIFAILDTLLVQYWAMR